MSTPLESIIQGVADRVRPLFSDGVSWWEIDALGVGGGGRVSITDHNLRGQYTLMDTFTIRVFTGRTFQGTAAYNFLAEMGWQTADGRFIGPFVGNVERGRTWGGTVPPNIAWVQYAQLFPRNDPIRPPSRPPS